MTFRRPSGGRIDRSRTLRFTFDGIGYDGHPGDTLASALLANGVRIVARGIESGRPRGIFSAGVEEPNALVQVESGACSEPMLRATSIELYDGLRARGLAGRGTVPVDPDPAVYDRTYAHCDVLVVGGGPAGLAAGLAAGRTGARVILLDDGPELGGTLLTTGELTDWLADCAADLAVTPEVTVLTRATAVGYYDANYVTVVENRTDHLGLAAPPDISRQRLRHIRATRVVLATGAHERPLVFADNDRPGVMLAGAARTYVNRYGVMPGRRAVVLTNNDSAYAAALDLAAAGVDVPLILDARPEPAGRWPARAREHGIEVLGGAAVVGTGADADGALRTVRATAGDRHADVGCDLLAVSGGWNPAVHLFSQSQGRTRYDEALGCFRPGRSVQAERSVGAADGVFDLAGCLRGGADAGREAAALAGFDGPPLDLPVVEELPESPMAPVWVVPAGDDDWSRHFVDLQRDATVGDIRRATGAGLRSVEHVKRYTTIGTGDDQGKTGGVAAVGVVAEVLGVSMADLGTTTYRPPYVPVSFGLLAGRDRGLLSDPVRTTPMHDWHAEHGAVFEDVGQWKRPLYYPREGEDMAEAVLRECAAARTGVALMDASTLGKIELRGGGVPEFLNRIYTNAFAGLPVGSCRYGVMCGADGMVFDDGVTIRLAADRYLMTTTTGNAAAVLDWLEEWLQTEWPELAVYCTSVTEQWATVAVVGPRSRAVLRELTDIDVSADAFPFMTWRAGSVAGVPARICRISFSGELAYEVNVEGWHGRGVWEALMAAGAADSITPYGTEAMHVLRAEKAYPIVGQETDGTVTPSDLGLDWAVSKTKEFVGRRSFTRPEIVRTDRKQLVGLLPVEPSELVPEGAQLVTSPLEPRSRYPEPVPMVGHVTSSYRSAVLGRTFALALVKGGRERMGETLYAPLVDRTIAVTVTDPVFYDPDGARRDG